MYKRQSNISPLVAHLLSLVARVNVVENGELGSEHKGEVLSFRVADVPAQEELVVEDESTNPLIVRPSSQARERSNGTNIGKQENETTARA